jgi:uncharacterized membrane protein
MTTHSHPALVHEKLQEQRTIGQKISDGVANTMGSWKFIIIQSVLLAAWIVFNVVELVFKPWDPYPFILLNLMLSFQAAYAAPFIMMSQNRQSQVDRAHAENAYHQVQETDKMTAEIHAMTKIVRDITLTQADLMKDIHDIGATVGAKLHTPPPE